MPPLGKLEASGSPWVSVLPENSAIASLAVGLEEAVVLLGGQSRQGIEDVRVVGGALGQRPGLHRRGHHVGHRGSSGAVSMVAMTDLKTSFGSRCRISALLKTLAPKISPGFSPGSKLYGGGTYASTSLMACRRTMAFPLN